MRRVVIESPFRGATPALGWRNKSYARSAVRDALLRGEAPIASHLLHTQEGILDDDVPAERAHGIAAGHVWIEVADAVVVYKDLGVSEGMKRGIEHAILHGIPVEYRDLPSWSDAEDEKGDAA